MNLLRRVKWELFREFPVDMRVQSSTMCKLFAYTNNAQMSAVSGQWYSVQKWIQYRNAQLEIELVYGNNCDAKRSKEFLLFELNFRYCATIQHGFLVIDRNSSFKILPKPTCTGGTVLNFKIKSDRMNFTIELPSCHFILNFRLIHYEVIGNCTNFSNVLQRRRRWRFK